MALSEIIIDNFVQSQTNIAISESSYQILRQYLLERKPILSVTNSINKILSDCCDADKQKVMGQIIQEACESQKDNDDQEARSDEYERNNDNALKTQYLTELFLIDGNLQQLNIKCFQQQQHCNFLNSHIHELQVSLAQVNNALDNIRLFRARYSQTQSYYSSHYHLQQHDVVYIYPDLHSQFDLSQLHHEENMLIAEQQRLSLLINTQSRESAQEQQNLNKLLQEKKHEKQRYSKIKQQIDIELPGKEQQRQLRHQERATRHYARNSYDPNLLQLSPQNLLAMQKQIEIHMQELDKKRNQLMQQAMEMSYPAYLTQLEYTLQQMHSGFSLTFSEQNALKMIVAMMKLFMEMAEKEKILMNSLTEERNNRDKLRIALTESTQKLQHYITAEPLLAQKNKELHEENAKLQLHSKSAANYRAGALYTSLFSIGAGLLSIGLVNTLILSPVFFAIPGALAILTLVSLTIAVVSYYQKLSSDAQIEQNKKTISENESTLVSQWKKASELSLTTIPDLNVQIEQSEKTIVWLEQQLIVQQYAMNQQLNKAQNVSCTYGVTPTFFGGIPHFPSAPPEDQVTPGKTSVDTGFIQ